MIAGRNIRRQLRAALVIACFIPSLVYAQPRGSGDWPCDGKGHYEKSPMGFYRSGLPEDFFEIMVGGSVLFYDDGVFYRKEGVGY